MLGIQFLTKNKVNSFLERLISGIILVMLAIICIGNGGWILYVVSMVLSMIGAGELYAAMKIRKQEKKWDLLEIFGYLGILIFYISLLITDARMEIAFLLADLILLMFLFVFTYPRYTSTEIMVAFFGIVYLGVMLSCVYQTRMMNNGQYLVWLIFLCSWGCDTCAYCAGRLFGRHKMAPVLSPKKTVEGAVGGVIGAGLLGMIYAMVTGGPAAVYALICVIGGLISMVGDLAASAIKRIEGIKDYGKLIPGHGGILDRFDSVIFTAPIIYYLAAALIH
ncbi:MAG: phosphatidate cytidylyltransferase [Eubacteriales bacterium]|nr:phosphatidate cytidylyltransferase [Eubacteriales bacterium]